MEPVSANHYAGIVSNMITTGAVPSFDKRKKYNSSDKDEETDYGFTYRISEDGKVQKGGAIQVFVLSEPISKYDFCGAPGSLSYMQMLQAAYDDETVKGVLLWVDSPGGQVDGTEAFANMVKAANKPIVAFADSLMASAAYWIGSAANEVIATDANNGYNATIGSIGTMCRMVDHRGNMEKNGYKEHLVFADASSDKWGDWFKVMGGDYTDLKASLNNLNDTFLAAVKANRAGKLKLNKENVLTGKTYTADDAIAYGLADYKGDFGFALGRLNTLIKKQKKQSLKMNNTQRFQNTLAAAQAESIEVTDAGFAMTEEQLQNVENTLTANAQALAEAQATATAAETRATEAEGKLEAVNTAKDAAEAALATANATIADMQAQMAEFKKGASIFTGGGSKAEQDPAPAHNEQVDLAELAHVKKAKEMGLWPSN